MNKTVYLKENLNYLNSETVGFFLKKEIVNYFNFQKIAVAKHLKVKENLRVGSVSNSIHRNVGIFNNRFGCNVVIYRNVNRANQEIVKVQNSKK